MKNFKNYILIGLALLFILLIIWGPSIKKTIFGPINETIESAQQIGGTLISNSEYTSTFSTWNIDIKYEYENETGRRKEIGKGQYQNREWLKAEEMIQIDDWLLLDTGGGENSDILYVGKADQNKWKAIEVSPQKIEETEFWKSKNITTFRDLPPSKSYIVSMNNNNIYVAYTFRTGQTLLEQESRMITYKLNTSTCTLEMIDIEK